MTHNFDAAVVIGRFQPFHEGHLALVREALRAAPSVYVVVGSAFAARSPRNPWTYEERAAMLVGSLTREERARVHCVPMRDYFDEPRWRKILVDTIGGLTGPNCRLAVVGHFKDSTSDYLEGFEAWGLLRVPLLGEVHGTQIRREYFAAEPSSYDLSKLSAELPAATLEFLAEFRAKPDYLALRKELLALDDYRRAWAGAPFPPVFVTVDAIVTCQSHVLLIQRGKAPGKGLWALPGGFLDQSETLLQAAYRELVEETGLVLPEDSRAPLKAQVFDHPQRSQRGRTISHGFLFQLNTAQLPPLTAADDAADLEWVAVSELTSRESEFFDDHFHVLDTFLGLLD